MAPTPSFIFSSCILFYSVRTWAKGLRPWAQLAIEHAPPHWVDAHTNPAGADLVYFVTAQLRTCLLGGGLDKVFKRPLKSGLESLLNTTKTTLS